MVEESNKPNPTFIVFSKLFLHEFKVESSWILGQFWVVLGPHPLTPVLGGPQYCAKWKASWRYIILVSFISIAFVVPQLSRFKYFPISQIWHFWELLGSFWAITPPNEIRFFPNLEHWCRSLFYMTYMTVFDIVLKFPRKQTQKRSFGAFLGGFWATPCHTLQLALKSFVKWKVSWR